MEIIQKNLEQKNGEVSYRKDTDLLLIGQRFRNISPLLRTNQYHLIEIQNYSPRKIIKFISLFQPKLILIDTGKQEEGIIICRLLKKTPGIETVPLILIDAKKDPLRELKAYKAGALDFISEPIFKESFMVKIRRAIRIFAVEIPQTKQLELTLRARKEKFKTLSNSQFEGIVIHNNGKIIEVNLAATKLFGYSSEELIGNHIRMLVPEESFIIIQENIDNHYEESYEAVGLHKDGHRFPLEIQSDETIYLGQAVRIAALRDISIHKESEKKLMEQQEKFMMSYLEAEGLLLNVLPEKVVSTLKNKNVYNPVYYNSATVLFTDFVNFTKTSERMNPMELLVVLNME